MKPPPIYTLKNKKYNFLCKIWNLKPGVPAAGRPGLRKFSYVKYVFVCQICQICQHVHLDSVRFAGRRSTAAVDMFARDTAVTLILFSSCKEKQAVLRTAGLRLCWSKAKVEENNLRQPLHSVPIPRLSKRHLGPTYSVLPLPDARMGRNSFKQTAVSINVSIHRICQYCAVFIQSDSFVSKSSVLMENTILAIIYQIYFRIL